MKISLIAILLFLMQNLCAQDLARNERFFNITQFSVLNMKDADYTLYTPSTGLKVTDLLNSKSYGLGVNTITGYYVWPQKISLGLGLGMDIYNEPDIITVPIYFDLRYYWLKGLNSPYFFFDLGAILSINDDFDKGHGGRFGIGYKFQLEDWLLMNFDIGINGKSIDISSQEGLLLRGVSFTIGAVLF